MAWELAGATFQNAGDSKGDPDLRPYADSLRYSSASEAVDLISRAYSQPVASATPAVPLYPPLVASPPIRAPTARRLGAYTDLDVLITGGEVKEPTAPPPSEPKAAPVPPQREQKRRNGFEAVASQRPGSDYYSRIAELQKEIDQVPAESTLKELMLFIESLVAAFGVKSTWVLYRSDFKYSNFVGKTNIDWRF